MCKFKLVQTRLGKCVDLLPPHPGQTEPSCNEHRWANDRESVLASITIDIEGLRSSHGRHRGLLSSHGRHRGLLSSHGRHQGLLSSHGRQRGYILPMIQFIFDLLEYFYD